MNPLTRQGIAAYKAGNKAEARRLLKQALQEDATDIPAWLCLSGAVEEAAEQAYCFQMVLRLDPNNVIAHNGMAKIEQNRLKAQSAINEPPTMPDFRAQLLHAAPFTTSDLSAPLPPEQPARPVRSAAAVPEKPSPTPAVQPAPAKTTGQAQPAPVHPRKASAKKQPSRKTTFQPWMYAALGGLGLLILLSLVVLMAIVLSRGGPRQAALADQQLKPSTATISLPPTSTPTASPIPSPTATRTPIPIPTATYMVLGPAMVKQMTNIQNEVSDLRGLPIQGEVPSYIVSKVQAEELLRSLFITDATRAELENEKRTLVILGLIKPTYDLVNLTLNQLVDNIGGFYLPEQKQIFVLAALRFGGVEHWVYSHEFDHALVDQSFNFGQMQQCPADAQRCQAVKALAEGDAQLLMNQWVKQYATPQDYKDFLSFRPPVMALPEQSPPPYLVQEMSFPYNQGLAFVTYLHRRGNWAGVNKAYANPPSSTEQILHPEKYNAGEAPIPVFAPAVETALAGDWQIIANSSLGEWTTYLLLFSGADEAAQIATEEAARAAAGWGGDHYQAYYSPSTDKTALAVQWAWDSQKDGREFEAALKKHLHELYRGSPKEQPGADCWEVNDQATCVISRPTMTLWLTAPNLPTILTMWGQYPDFKETE